MARKAFRLAGGIIVLSIIISCNLSPTESGFYYRENNPTGFVEVPLTSENLNRLSFGTSSREANGSAAAHQPGCVIEDNLSIDGSVTITSTNASNNAGKIAGSEDGIAYFFKEVDKDKNFRLSADFYVETYGFSNGKTDLNGQEGWGIMARDYVPQYIWTGSDGKRYDATMEGIRTGVNTEDGVSPSNTSNTTNGMYYTGKGRADGPGGSGNMIMVGGVKRGARVYWRTGVTDPVGDAVANADTVADASKAKFYYLPREFADYSMYGTGRSGIEARPDFPTAGLTYSLTLEKTNSGFKAKITPPKGVGKGVTKAREPSDGAALEYNDLVVDKGVVKAGELYFPDGENMLFSINKENYYVGFFVCRDAKVKITNIRYEEADAADCAPLVSLEPELYTPSFSVTSPATASTADYTLYARSNVEGVLSVRLNGREVKNYSGAWTTEKSNASAEPFALFTVRGYELKDGDNVFNTIFTPSVKQANLQAHLQVETNALLANTTPISQTFVVTKKAIGADGGDIYVSPAGRSYHAGTRESPLDLETAIAYVQPGQRIIMLKGIYTPLAVTIPRYNNGTADHYKYIIAEERDKAIIDFQQNLNAKGFEVRGDYWHISGIHVRNAPNKVKGLTVMGSFNIVEWVKTYFNGDTGIQISGSSAEPKALWPSNNQILYCESFANMDESREDADGFASKLTSGEGNVFKWCVAHHNADDGWDLFAKKETGAIGALKLEHCIAYSNGKFLNAGLSALYGGKGIAEESSRSGGNGFKMGGEGIPVTHEAVDCLSFNNDADGFTSNSDPAILLTHCTSYDNGGTIEDDSPTANKPGNYAIYGAGSAGYTGLDAVVTQIVSLYSSGDSRDRDRVEVKMPSSGYWWDGTQTINTSGRTLTVAANMVSTAVPYHAGGVAPFDDSIQGNFLVMQSNNDGETPYGIGDTGAYALNGFMQLKEVYDLTKPGARGLWN
ncbi:MAG: hypothetical protein LBF60_03420 [Treponema sp.]|jgi:hypothetical protein|nr:hypothetical protein [Treponema sp.]